MKPHPNNACSGKYDDWLEVNLLPQCNAKCDWCIEKKGWHPDEVADWGTIADAAIASGKQNIILLGGEPTIYPHLKEVVAKLVKAGKSVWITTNGSKLSVDFVEENLQGIAGVNISIHNHCLSENFKITKVNLNFDKLYLAIRGLHSMGAKVRLNCNCIKGC